MMQSRSFFKTARKFGLLVHESSFFQQIGIYQCIKNTKTCFWEYFIYNAIDFVENFTEFA